MFWRLYWFRDAIASSQVKHIINTFYESLNSSCLFPVQKQKKTFEVDKILINGFIHIYDYIKNHVD